MYLKNNCQDYQKLVTGWTRH